MQTSKITAFITSSPRVASVITGQAQAKIYPGVLPKEGVDALVVSLSTLPTMEKSNLILCAKGKCAEALNNALTQIRNFKKNEGVSAVRELINTAIPINAVLAKNPKAAGQFLMEEAQSVYGKNSDQLALYRYGFAADLSSIDGLPKNIQSKILCAVGQQEGEMARLFKDGRSGKAEVVAEFADKLSKLPEIE